VAERQGTSIYKADRTLLPRGSARSLAASLTRVVPELRDGNAMILPTVGGCVGWVVTPSTCHGPALILINAMEIYKNNNSKV